MTATRPTTGALHDALHDLDRSDLTTDTGRTHAFIALDHLDRYLGDYRQFVAALDQQPAPVQGEQQ